MKQILFFIALLGPITANAQYNYPPTKTVEVSDTYFGVTVSDPYRWLEDLNNQEVQDWFKLQNEFTNSLLEKIPGRDKLYKRIKTISEMGGDIKTFPKLYGNTYYFIKFLKGESFGKFYARDAGTGEETLFFDHLAYKKGSQLVDFKMNRQANLMALLLLDEGSELGEIIFINPVDKSILPDKLYPVWSEFNFDFLPDGKSFIYTKMNTSDLNSDELLKNMKAMLHRIGEKPENDMVIASAQTTPDIVTLSERFPMVSMSYDNQYLFLNIASVKPECFAYYTAVTEAFSGEISWKLLIREEDDITDFITFGNRLFFLTHKDAPHFRIGVTDLDKPDFINAQTIAAYPDKTIISLQTTRNYLVFSLSNGITQEKYQLDPRTSSVQKIPLPGGVNGSTNGLNPAENDKIVFVNNNWLTPYAVFEYDAATGDLNKDSWLNPENNYPDYEELYSVSEVEVPGHDGVMIPLSIIYPKNLKRDGNNPCIITGYGGYGISIKPSFLREMTVFLEQGGILAVAHVRGGGEKGKGWHLDGMKEKKPNTWKDFISCAEYLVREKYTSPEKLIGEGASMGGILIGRAITERPDLFAVAINEVGMTQVLRNETTANGDNQIPEVGSVKNEKEFPLLLEMDVQSKIRKDVKYPASFVITGINDSRVVPWMPGKFTAAMQEVSTSGKPVVMRVDYNAGHFANDLENAFQRYADQFAFVLWQTGHPEFQPKE